MYLAKKREACRQTDRQIDHPGKWQLVAAHPPNTRHALRALPRKDAYAAVTTAALVQLCNTCRSIKWMPRNARTALDRGAAVLEQAIIFLAQTCRASCSSRQSRTALLLVSRDSSLANGPPRSMAQSCILGSSHHIAWQIIRSYFSHRTPSIIFAHHPYQGSYSMLHITRWGGLNAHRGIKLYFVYIKIQSAIFFSFLLLFPSFVSFSYSHYVGVSL